jgi:sensor domain CHASE-containing protein
MSDPTLIIFATIVVGAIQVISLAAIKAWTDKNHQASEQAKRQISEELAVVHRDVNGKMDKMQEVIKTAAFAEGKLQGRAEEKSENNKKEN